MNDHKWMFIAALFHTSVYIGTYFHDNYKCTAATVVTLFMATLWRGTLVGGNIGKLICFKHLAKESWWINRSANRLLMISTNLDDYSLVNHGQFTKFANISPAKVFLHMVMLFLYSKYFCGSTTTTKYVLENDW